MKSIAGAGLMLVLTGCNAGPDNGALAQAEAQGSKDAAISGRIDCALGGAKLFDRTCTIAEMSSADGTILIVGRSDSGYRRLQVTTDGRGVVSADGVDPAKVTVIGDGVIEVAVGPDRYRLPANTGGAK